MNSFGTRESCMTGVEAKEGGGGFKGQNETIPISIMLEIGRYIESARAEERGTYVEVCKYPSRQ